MRTKVRYVLFDLDGTLVDTALDMASALNQALATHGKPPLPFEKIRPVVSLGSAAMILAGFNITETATDFIPLRDEFLEIYRNNLTRHSRLFPGMEQVLAELEKNGSRWGIVTNKPGWLTRPLLQGLGLDTRTNCIVSGDTLNHRKPHPAPLLHACQLLNCAPNDTLYAGDARRDVEAGINAGMTTLVAAYGYIGAADDPESWGADGLINSPAEILRWINAGDK